MLASSGNIVEWQWTDYNMIILYAALQAIPPDLYEAALVDGATGWKVARYIKIPLIAPVLVLACVLSIIGSLQLFTEPQLMSTLPPNVILDHYTPNLSSYHLAFHDHDYDD